MGPVRMQAMHTFVGGGVTARLMVLLLALAGDAAGAAALARTHRSGMEQKRRKMRQELLGSDAARAPSRDRGMADASSSAGGQVSDDARPGPAARAEPAAADGEGRDAARQATHGSGGGQPGSAGGSGSLPQRGSPSPVPSEPACPSMAYARTALVTRCAELLAAPVLPAARLAVNTGASVNECHTSCMRRLWLLWGVWGAAQSCSRVCGSPAGASLPRTLHVKQLHDIQGAAP